MKIKYLFLLIVIIFLVGCSSNIVGIKDIDLINTRTNEKTTLNTNSQTAKLIKEAINKSEKIENFSMEPDFEVIMKHKNGEDDAYFFAFNYDDQKTYIFKDDNIYEVKDYVSKKFFLNDDFADLYVNNTIPSVVFKKNEELLDLSGQYKWTFRRVNNSFFEKEGIVDTNNNILNVTNDDNFSLNFGIEPDNYIFKIYDNGEIVRTSKSFNDIVKNINSDGEYYIELVAKWNEKINRDYYGEQNINFVANVDLPTELELLSNDNYPGNALSVMIKNSNADESLKISCTAVDSEIEIFKHEDGYISIMPISLATVPGEYELICTVNEGKDNEYKLSKTFTVNDKSFKTQYLEIADDVSNQTRTQEANKEYAEFVKAARNVSSSEKLWDGNFIMPIEGILTTDFAEIRYVNDEKTSSRHSGIDLAASKGTKIKASNTGKVVLTRYMILTGNTIVIDHGFGLFTTYYHLDTMDVKAGDEVKKGDIIGTVGSTGFSTGPHLHFTFSIHNNYVNPYQPIINLFE